MRISWRVTALVLGFATVIALSYIAIGQPLGTSIAAMGALPAIVALVLYISDAVAVEPVVIQRIVRIMDEPNRYLIEALISNNGGKEATQCDMVVEIGGNLVSRLSYIPVDSPLGRIGSDWPIEDTFTLYPRIPISVRGYASAPANTRVTVALRYRGRRYGEQTFALPQPTRQRGP